MIDDSYLALFEGGDAPVMPVRFVVSISSGASSAVAADRVLNRFGAANVDLVFADTLVEDADNYRFLDDLERRWNKRIIRLTDGRTPKQLWTQKAIVPNDQLAPCTYDLKIKLIIGHVKQLHADGYAVVMCIGMNPKDARPRGKDKPNGRLHSPIKNWAGGQLAYVEYPLLWIPKDYDSVATVKAWGIEPPRMYRMQFSNANCSGLCPKGGVGSWRKTLLNFRDKYLEIEAWERDMRQDARFEKYTILTREINGNRENLTLEQLRIETDAATAGMFRIFAMLDDMGNTCGSECGVNSDWN
jgi:hypothetical protein